jgi:hypothetical protein
MAVGLGYRIPQLHISWHRHRRYVSNHDQTAQCNV